MGHLKVEPGISRCNMLLLHHAQGGKQMNLTKNILIIGLLTCAIALAAWTTALPALTAEPASITEETAHAIGLEAYLYFYPLITMDLTRKHFTNVEPGQMVGKVPMNMFFNAPIYPPAYFKGVVRPNFDTLFSSAWLDLTKEPMIVSTPDTNGRFYLMQMLDMWTDTFAAPGWRTTGTQTNNFLVFPPGWRPDLRGKEQKEFELPKNIQRIDAPTPYVWIIGRTRTDGPPDFEAVHKIQAGYKITSISLWGKAPKPVTVKIDPTVDMTTPPKVQVDAMSAGKFFAYAAELLKLNPPHITDQPIIAVMKRIGIEQGKNFDLDKADPMVKKALETAPKEAQELMKSEKLLASAKVENGWSVNPDIGVYGNNYLRRAIIAQQGLGANSPEDAIYPMTFVDATGKPLDGANNYTIHFDKGATPPVDEFWSITLYDPEGYQVSNVINRFALSSWMPFKYNPDGSLDLYLQNKSPDKESNWLPTPKGPFNLTMRLYAPKREALTGKWNPPPVIKAQATPLSGAR